MTPHTIPQTVLFPDLFDKPLVATFNQEHASSDGGAVLLKAAERVYGLVKAFARCLADKRAPGKIRHTLADLIGQRVFGIACGHPDGNDADHLADDPIHKLLLGRDPVSGAPLASQPTISRFENGARRTVLYRMGRELAASVIERHRRRLHGRARRITIDLDPTDDLYAQSGRARSCAGAARRNNRASSAASSSSAGGGQPNPLWAALSRYNETVPTPIAQAWAIARWDSPRSC